MFQVGRFAFSCLNFVLVGIQTSKFYLFFSSQCRDVGLLWLIRSKAGRIFAAGLSVCIYYRIITVTGILSFKDNQSHRSFHNLDVERYSVFVASGVVVYACDLDYSDGFRAASDEYDVPRFEVVHVVVYRRAGVCVGY